MSTALPSAPPPHPYAAPVRRPGRGIAITAMALGLAGLITVAVTPLLSGGFAVGGALLGLAGAVLGIVGLVLRQRTSFAVVGLSAGALAVVLALVWGLVSVGTFLAGTLPGLHPQVTEPDRGAPGERPGHDGSGPGHHGGPGPGPASGPIEWPRNMRTGGVVFFGPDGAVVESDVPPARSLPEPRTAAELGAPALIRVYQDYRCPYCATFEEANAKTLDAVVEQRAAAVEVLPLTFLDRASEGSYYSSRAAGVLACLADSQPEAAWPANRALLSADVQPAEGGPGHDNAALLSAVERATGSLTSPARDCITEERFVPFAQALSEWVFATPVPHAVDPELTVSGTPFVVVDGVPYPGDPANPEEFRAFLTQQGVSLT